MRADYGAGSGSMSSIDNLATKGKKNLQLQSAKN
jgi:hypothetical protein